MKFLTFSVDGRESYGAATTNGVVDLGKRFGDEYPTLKELIAAGLPLRITTTVNGRVMQDDTAGAMVHKIPRFVEYVSSFAPLYPGDILATGTPSGVGFSRKPPVYLQEGDTCEISIDRVGVLRNRVEPPDTGHAGH